MNRRWGLWTWLPLLAMVIAGGCTQAGPAPVLSSPAPLPAIRQESVPAPLPPPTDIHLVPGQPPSSPTITAVSPSTPNNKPPDQASTALPSDAPDGLETILARLDRSRALTDLRRITGEQPLCLGPDCGTIINRKTGSAGLSRVTEYVAGELQSAGYQVERNPWSTLWYSGHNLIAVKPGQLDRRILLVAHLDGVAEDQRQRYPGADDNGSGVADVLETARAIAPYTFERSVVLFFSSGEEQGSLGVKSYLQGLTQDELDQIEAVIDIDVIGYDANEDQVMQIFHGDHPASMALAERMQAVIIEQRLHLKPQVVKGCG